MDDATPAPAPGRDPGVDPGVDPEALRDLQEWFVDAEECDERAFDLFFTELAQHADEAVVLAFCQWVLARLADGSNVPAIARVLEELARRRAPRALPALRAFRADLPAPPRGVDWRVKVDVVIALLENAAAGHACNCRVFATNRFNLSPFSKGLEFARSRAEIDVEDPRVLHAKCPDCGQHWVISREDGPAGALFHWDRA